MIWNTKYDDLKRAFMDGWGAAMSQMLRSDKHPDSDYFEGASDKAFDKSSTREFCKTDAKTTHENIIKCKSELITYMTIVDAHGSHDYNKLLFHIHSCGFSNSELREAIWMLKDDNNVEVKMSIKLI